MPDEKDPIVALYWQRDENAIEQTQQAYGTYLTRIAYHVLSDWEDSREAVNDAYLRAWNAIPPHRPQILSSFLAKLARQAAIDLLRKRTSSRRPPSQYALALSELEDCVSVGNATEHEIDMQLLTEALNRFVRTLPLPARTAFVRRYFHLDPIQDIARDAGMTVTGVKSLLHRTRQRLKAYLKQEGFEV